MGFLNSLVDAVTSGLGQSALKSLDKPEVLGGKRLREWELEWRNVGILGSTNFGEFRHDVGVYKAMLHGELMYIGRAIEFDNGGFRKRLHDYVRDSNSSRKHESGQMMNTNADDLDISIIITGQDSEAALLASRIEKALIFKYSPPWNKQWKSLLS